MLEVNLINVLGVAVLSVMLAFWYQPIQKAKGRLIRVFSFFPSFSFFLDKIFNCTKCSSFIIGVLLFWNLPAAALCSFVGYLVGHIIDRVEQYYE